MNTVTIIGNLGRDPELRATPTGRKVTNFSVATTERWKNAAGETQSHTEWHAVVCWGRQAEIAKEFLAKGSPVAVIGSLRTRSWDDKQTGEKRYRTEIQCDRLELIGRRPAQAEASTEEETAVAATG